MGTGTWAHQGQVPPYLHSLRWQPSGPSSLSAAVPACSVEPLFSSAALPLWTVTAWHLLLPGSYHICTAQHLSKEHRVRAQPEESGCQCLCLDHSWDTIAMLLASPNRKGRLGAGTLQLASSPLISACLQIKKNSEQSLQCSSPQGISLQVIVS